MIKQISIVIIFNALFYAASAQTWEHHKNSIKMDLAQFSFSGNIEFDYERFSKKGSSVLFSGGYTINGMSSQIRNYQRWGATGEIQWRKYLLPLQADRNFRMYIGPFLRYKFLEYSRDQTIVEWVESNGEWTEVEVKYESQDQFSSYYTGFVLGYNVLLGKSGIIDLFVGAGVKINGRVLYPEEYGFLQTGSFGLAVNPGYAGILPRAGVRIGGIF
ncbi:hypothetical protein N9R81_05505 [Flavobacteriales bacterium]|nr:hypothetical protein [Flavobacteriales bacterium]